MSVFTYQFIYLGGGPNTWTSEENVQQWINDIEQRSTNTSQASSPTKSSFDGDVFLQLPGGGGGKTFFIFCLDFFVSLSSTFTVLFAHIG